MRHPPLPKLSKLYQAFLVLLAKKPREQKYYTVCPCKQCQRQKLGCNLLALQEKSSAEKQPGPQVDGAVPTAPVGLCTPTQCQSTDSLPSGGRMLSSQGSHNQALVCSQTAQVLWLLALNQDTLWLSHMAWEEDACANVRDRAAFVYRLLAMVLCTPHPPPARSELQERKLHKPEGLME